MLDDEATGEKLFALARAARARIEAAQGAAVADETGRTYAAATVTLPHLSLSAASLAAAMAAAAGAHRLHSCVLVGAVEDGIAAADIDVLADLSCAAITLRRPSGDPVQTWSAA